MPSFVKDPDAVLDYLFDWAIWLATGETISTSTVIVPSGITLTNDSKTSTSATAWLAGGAAGQVYEVTNRISTNQGRTNDYTIHIIVRQT